MDAPFERIHPEPGRSRPTGSLPAASVVPVGISGSVLGYGLSGARSTRRDSPDTTTGSYADEQVRTNAAKARDYVVPLATERGARTVLDVGCGVGAMVTALLDAGMDAYGVDLPGLASYWHRAALPTDRLFCVESDPFVLPFEDGAFDLVCSFGVIEHVGTRDGHADRLDDYHDVRSRWLREVWRVVRPAGHALIAGPNRGFPVDVAHGSDARALAWERWLSRRVGVTVHRPWGQNFLWSYGDVRRYLRDVPHRLEPLSPARYLGLSRVPSWARPVAQAYLDHLPRRLLGTGFNPWVMALISRPEAV
jgi:SAM-dependent methyltransferase